MTRRARSLLLLFAFMAVALLSWRAMALARASADASRAREQLATVAQQAQEVLDLRAKRPTTGMGPKPGDDLTKLITGILKDAGIPSERLRSVSPDTETRLAPDPLWPGVSRRRQSARVTIEPLTPQDLGVLVLKWRSSQSVWSVSGMELAKISGGGVSPEDRSYRGHFSLTATYVDGPKRP